MTGLSAAAAPQPDDDLIEKVSRRHLRSVSRCISWIENGQDAARPLLEALAPRAGRAMVVGVTGVPGAGKSTTVPALARRFAAAGRSVAILAVDPSSPLSGGAILGDRIRDPALGETNIFFRSVASRGSLGGLSHTLDDVVTLLDAAGFEVILIETVGTGQSEIAVTRLAHTTVMLTAPGLGDEIQAMKAGIIEVADLVVVNKADSDPRGAQATALALREAISQTMRAHGLTEGRNEAAVGRDMAWLPPVVTASALTGSGMDALAASIAAHRRFLDDSGHIAAWRRMRFGSRLLEVARQKLFEQALERHRDGFDAAVEAVSSGALTVFEAAEGFALAALGAPAPPAAKRIVR